MSKLTLKGCSYLAKTAQNHQKTAKEEEDTGAGSSVAASTSEAHEIAGQRGQREQEADECPVGSQKCFVFAQACIYLTVVSGYRMSCEDHQRLCSVGRGRASRTARERLRCCRWSGSASRLRQCRCCGRDAGDSLFTVSTCDTC